MTEEAPATKPAPTVPSVPVFPTNRQNLLQILSSGLVGPRQTYGKYYEDLLEAVSGSVPLVRTPVPQDVIAALGPADDETSFPVLVEIDPVWLGVSDIPVLAADGTAGGQSAASDWRAAAFPGTLPRVAVTRIHFRSERDLEEHTLREFANVDNASWELAVSPDLFGDDAEPNVLDWLMSLAPVDFDERAFRIADSLTGAIAGFASAVPGDVEALESLLDLLNGSDRGKTAGLCRIGLLRPGKDAKPSGAEEVLVSASVEILHDLDPDASWSSSPILAAIRERVADYKLSKRDTQTLASALDKAADIVGMRRDFEPFKETGLDSVKALLLVLLRPDPVRLLAWDPVETGASPAVMGIACALAGIAQGRTKLAAELRPTPLDRRLTFLATRPGFVDGTSKVIAPEVTASMKGNRISLVLDGQSLVERELAQPSLADLLQDADRSDPKAAKAMRLLVDRMGWTDCVTVYVTVPPSGAGVTVETVEAGVQFTFAQCAEMRRSVDTKRVLARLTEVQLPVDVEDEARSCLDR